MLHVADNANDGAHERFLVADAPARFDVFADRILAREKLLDELLVHDHHRQRFELVGLLETTALPNGNAHGLEIIRAHDPHRAVRLLSFGRGMFLDVKRTDVVAAAERKRPRDRDRFDAGNRPEPRHELIEKCDDVFRFRIGRFRQSDACREKTLRPHAGLDVAEARESLNQQAGANEEDQRERHLRHDQGIAHTMFSLHAAGAARA